MKKKSDYSPKTAGSLSQYKNQKRISDKRQMNVILGNELSRKTRSVDK